MFYYRSAYPRGLRSSFRKKGSNRRRHCFVHRGGRANTILLLQRSRSKFDRGFVVRNRNITSHSSSFPAWRPSTGRPSRAPLNIGVSQRTTWIVGNHTYLNLTRKIRSGAGQIDFRYFGFSVLMVATPMTVTPLMSHFVTG